MASHVYKRGPTTPEMNITPLIDVVFLLIVFFMLVNTIRMQEAAEMFVPDIDESQVREIPREGRIVVNVVPESFDRTDRSANPLAHQGTPRFVQVGAGQRQYAMDDLTSVTTELERARENNPEVEVVLRADAAIYYREVQPVMDAITAAGIQRVNMVAYDPRE